MENYTLKIDPETRDLCLDDAGVLELVDGDATSARLSGSPWRHGRGSSPSTLLTEPTTPASPVKRPRARRGRSPEVIRDAVLQETTVSEVDSVEYNLSGRSLEVSVTGTLTTGGVITTEVSTL